MTADLVVRRVGTFADGRRPFVVTNSYIGPSRRAKRREDGSDDDLIEVPNTLRSKMIDNAHLSQLRQIIDAAVTAVGQKKNETRLKAVVRLTQKLLAQQAEHSRAGEMRRTLDLLAEKADEVVADHKDSATAHVAEIAARIGKLARRISSGSGRPGNVEVSLLARLSDAVVSSFTASAAAVEIAHAIAGMVDKYIGPE